MGLAGDDTLLRDTIATRYGQPDQLAPTKVSEQEWEEIDRGTESKL
jgi:hypothetical protein